VRVHDRYFYINTAFSSWEYFKIINLKPFEMGIVGGDMKYIHTGLREYI
jgi:hypothetical protein